LTRHAKAVAALAAVVAVLATGCATHASAAAERRNTTCSFLQDGKGKGSALSARPNRKPYAGQIARAEPISVAWRVCVDEDTNQIWLASAHSWCFTSEAGDIKLEKCGADHGQNFTPHPQNGGGVEYRDDEVSPGLDICPSDGPGSLVNATERKYCSAYHRTFLFHQVGTKVLGPV